MIEIGSFFIGIFKDFFDFARKQLDEADTILFGRITYEMMAGYWPDTVDDDPVITDKMNSLLKIVFSKTLSTVTWNNSILIKNLFILIIYRISTKEFKQNVGQ